MESVLPAMNSLLAQLRTNEMGHGHKSAWILDQDSSQNAGSERIVDVHSSQKKHSSLQTDHTSRSYNRVVPTEYEWLTWQIPALADCKKHRDRFFSPSPNPYSTLSCPKVVVFLRTRKLRQYGMVWSRTPL